MGLKSSNLRIRDGRSKSGSGSGVDFRGIEERVVFERTVEGPQGMADGADEGLQLGFATRSNVVIESRQVGLDGDQGGHAEDSRQRFGGDVCL